MTVQKVLAFTLREEILSAHRAEVEILGSEFDPLQELEFGNVLEARLCRMNFGGGFAFPLPVLPVNPKFMFRNWALRYR